MATVSPFHTDRDDYYEAILYCDKVGSPFK